MVRDVPIDSAHGLVVVSWQSREGGIYVRGRGQDEDIRLHCVCGRCHWIVRELIAENAATLILSCHSCGEQRTFSMEGVPSHVP